MQLSFYFDQSACIGCGECEQICKSERNLQDTESFRKVVTIEENDEVNSLSYSCYHCANPACADACPVGAIYKREEDGIVLVNSDKCAAQYDCLSASLTGQLVGTIYGKRKEVTPFSSYKRISQHLPSNSSDVVQSHQV